MSRGLSEKSGQKSKNQLPRKDRFYVAYKGDQIVTTGTPLEISQRLGIPYDHVLWLTTPTARKREEQSIKKNGHSKRMVLIEG